MRLTHSLRSELTNCPWALQAAVSYHHPSTTSRSINFLSIPWLPSSWPLLCLSLPSGAWPDFPFLASLLPLSRSFLFSSSPSPTQPPWACHSNGLWPGRLYSIALWRVTPPFWGLLGASWGVWGKPENRYVTYVNKKGERSTMPLNQALDSNNAEMTKRLKYTKDILTHMLNNNQ